LDLTFREIDEYLQCLNRQIFDDKKFNADIHGAKFKRTRPPRYIERAMVPEKNDQMDKLAERLMVKQAAVAMKEMDHGN